MGLQFISYRSGSSGNCLGIWTDKTNVLVDLGLDSQRQCMEILQSHVKRAGRLDGLVVTHRHSDHINYASLRTIEKTGLKVYAHGNTKVGIEEKYYYSKNIKYKTFASNDFKIGDLNFLPFEVDHQPGILTHGFVVTTKQKGVNQKAVIATDFFRFKGIIQHFRNANLIYIESNHDPELLEENPNFLSRYHMPNERTGKILAYSMNQSSNIPRVIILGHLSEERNNPDLAEKTVRKVCKAEGIDEALPLIVAPRYRPIRTIKIS
jgi:phosphoribosyl 1,2-cyclic phosphodiesterase